MTDGTAYPFAGLPAELTTLLTDAPVEEKMLAELIVSWPGLDGAERRMAEALRLFVVTWDPLELSTPRPEAAATVNADPPGLEVVVYVPLWWLLQAATEGAKPVAEMIGELASSAVVVAASIEEVVVAGLYPSAVRQGSVRPLLSDRAGAGRLGVPRLSAVSEGWEPIGLGAVTDVVQDAHGPLELDRSPVELAAVSDPTPGCAACHGRRFGFPGELAKTAPSMCSRHRAEADRVTSKRLGRAATSNPDGWSALVFACTRLELPHLPNGLASRLAGAPNNMFEIPEPEELAAEAHAVVEAAKWFPGRPEDFALALGAEDGAPWLPEWLRNLVLDLGHTGLGDEAVAVGEALCGVDPASASEYAADMAVALATAGATAAARARVETNLRQWRDDLWVRVHAGDALQIIGDTDEAEAQFLAALDMADEADNFEARSDIVERLAGLGRTVGPTTSIRVLKPSRGRAPPVSPRLGRNDACFCGSGRKYKHCHGRRS